MKALQKTNLAEQAYTVIHQMLLDGAHVQPGDKISVEDLARRLGVSRSPVWQAIARLEAERIIEVRPRQGVFFIGFNRERLLEIFGVREVLEGAAARLAAERSTPEAVSELRHSIARQRAVVDHPSQQAYADEATRFHHILAQLAGNSVMTELIGRLWDQTKAMCIRPEAKSAILDARVDEHERIVDAVARGDADAAEAETRHHIRRIAVEVYNL
ncbi:GntR family transcriptional regulator [Paramagnetospirillum kuznetsovii]|uniref:GntR family transcriptional regulator n=1 Tax=Paramagnetospirillum kuznetsovii TaxID=2053833 RepID=A0A364P3K5_9PROT|nr:GntR family transcriptional regulator [Paramagnetospirillum kuznetsovii]RAU23870.1 GntR family transcriptional regulator [Paramagnetospirillum kuznetsovii]